MYRRNNKKIFSMTAGAVILVAMFAMVLNVTTNASGTKKIENVALKIGKKTVTEKTYSMKKGKKATIKVNVTPQKAEKDVVFKSSNKKVVAVSQKGVITAKKKGSAKISVVVNGKNGESKSTWVKIKVTGKASEEPAGPDEETEPGGEPEPTTAPDPIKIEELNIPDGTSNIYGKIYMPEKEGKYPAIIMCHGYNGTNADFTNECRYFAQNGYVAYAFDFCGGSGRSKSSGKSTDMTIFTEKSNLLAVFRHIKGLDNVDPERVFVHGGSQGGLVAALATEEIADEVKGLILYFPAFNIPDDWRVMHPVVEKIPEKIPFWGLDLGKEFAVSIHDFNTFEHVGSYPKNVLILYGAKDAIVKRSYMDKAKETYQNCELIVYPDEGHGFTPAGAVKAREEVYRFMQEQ